MRNLYAPDHLTLMIVNSQVQILNLIMDFGVAKSFLESGLENDYYPYAKYLWGGQKRRFCEPGKSKVTIDPLWRERQRKYFKYLEEMAPGSMKRLSGHAQ